ncbi:hypothetical protein MMC28_000712 [Mycoblastus sanguinarius]|nr:hypothetical protein [Mycoblastus sanguinarius]
MFENASLKKWSSGSTPKGGSKATEAKGPQPSGVDGLERRLPVAQPDEVQRVARLHLPGGQQYQETLDKIRQNDSPRQGTPVPQWLHEWEEKWQRLGGEGKPNRKSSLTMMAICLAYTL